MHWKRGASLLVGAIILWGRAQAAPFPLGVSEVMDAYQASKTEKTAALHDCYTLYNVSIKFTHEDVTITIKHQFLTVQSVTFTRSTPFSSLEIPDLLTPLSSAQDWAQKGDKNWESTGSQLTAHWDGESSIVVEAASTGQP